MGPKRGLQVRQDVLPVRLLTHQQNASGNQWSLPGFRATAPNQHDRLRQNLLHPSLNIILSTQCINELFLDSILVTHLSLMLLLVYL